MKTAGIIAEYNPFHTGHSYHIQETKRLTGADHIVVVMSGDFVQRGGPAFLPRHIRTRMALLGGADVVLELPPLFSCQSAEFFARRSVEILDSLGCIDYLSFGSESGNIRLLRSLGQFLCCEPDEYKTELKKLLKSGMSFPAARQTALLKFWKNDPESIALLNSPNNILAAEYCKALHSCGSAMEPVTVLRRGSGYHETGLTNIYPSASGIRDSWNNCPARSDLGHLSSSFPEEVWPVLDAYPYKDHMPSEDDFSLIFRYILYTSTVEELCTIQDVTKDLAARLIKNRDSFSSVSQYILSLRSKDITYSRLCRAVFHIILNIKSVPPVEYVRLLGFRKEASCVLHEIKKKGRLPLLTKLADAPSILDPGPLDTLNKNVAISHIYESTTSSFQNRKFINEYTRQLVIV